jgi:hypothetical protein
MRRERLRPAYSERKLLELYRLPHDSSRWRDHEVRVAATIALARGFEGVESVADLSAGDGRIARAVEADVTILGDFAPGYPIAGPIEQTLLELPEVDLYICSETLEHLDDPDAVLRELRPRTRFAVISTPLEAWSDYGNPEHYWSWDRDAVEAMISAAGFELEAFCRLDLRPGWSPYCFGIWALR